MVMIPIQVMPEGVLIPLQYLQDAREFEFEVIDGHVLVRPKANGQKNWLTNLNKSESEQPTSIAEPTPRYAWIGITQGENPNASIEVEEILNKEIDLRAGWTVKK